MTVVDLSPGYGQYLSNEGMYRHLMMRSGKRIKSVNTIEMTDQYYSGNWSVTYNSDPPYMLTGFRIAPDHGVTVRDLYVELNGTRVLGRRCSWYSSTAANKDFLVGLFFTDQFSSGPIVALTSIKVGSDGGLSANAYYSWTIEQFEFV